MKTVAEVMLVARAAGLDRLDAQLLLAHVFGCTRSWLLAHDDAPLAASQQELLAELLHRRASGEPLAYLVGEKEFHGLALRVSPAVLIPRPDTETLVDWALELLCEPTAPTVLDMGTGSGAIALALKRSAPHAQVTATDVSTEALKVAADNARLLTLDIDLMFSDWWQKLDERRFDVIVSNPPYIAQGDVHLAALRHEPLLALTPGGDGLNAFRHIVAGAPQHLVPGGWLLLEHGHDQAPALERLLRSHGFDSISARTDLGGNARCTGGRLS